MASSSANHEMSIADMFQELSNKIDKSSEKVNSVIYNMETRLAALEAQSAPRHPLSNVDMNVAKRPERDGKKKKVDREDILKFIRTCLPGVDEKAASDTYRELLTWTNCLCNDLARTFGDEPLLNWFKLSTDQKNFLLDGIELEGEKMGLVMKKCTDKWVARFLVSECWRNKAKYGRSNKPETQHAGSNQAVSARQVRTLHHNSNLWPQ